MTISAFFIAPHRTAGRRIFQIDNCHFCYFSRKNFPPSRRAKLLQCAHSMKSALASVRLGPGRPRKFAQPSRPVTVTLPEDTLTRLGTIDADLGRAIVAL